MWFDSELNTLEREQATQRMQLRRSVRQVSRSLAPKRLIRRHPLVCAGAACLVGAWMAPGPARARSRETVAGENGNASGPGILGKLLHGILQKVMPSPTHKPATEAEKGAPAPDPFAVLIASSTEALQMFNVLAGAIAARIGKSNVAAENNAGGREEAAGGAEEVGEVEIADAGTVHLDGGEATPFNFENAPEPVAQESAAPMSPASV